ncbi:MAG: hypothetical protein ACI9KE_005502 [Polyangiales bacterium]|jgi:hypothetical protein
MYTPSRAYVRAQLAIVAQRAAKSPRERADPLTDRDLGEDGVRRAAMSDMRRPRHDGQNPRHLHEKPTTISWPHPRPRELDEAVLQNPASQIRIELFVDELRRAALGFGALAKSRPVLAHQRLQERIFRSPRRVAIAARWLGRLQKCTRGIGCACCPERTT